jgi:predicted dehydrogenase
MSDAVLQIATPPGTVAKIPRLGFLGVGWIGLQRMQAIENSGVGRAMLICDPEQEATERALQGFAGASRADCFERLLDADLDGIVIATPSAQHAEQSVAALEAGLAVFCQKPLGRSAAEVSRVVEAARRADRLLSVDLSYRYTAALQAVRETVRSGEIGEVFAADLVFHNAYGPDKAWFYDRMLSGGGCVMDLGIHLVDAALWIVDSPVARVSGRIFAKGKRLRPPFDTVEDYATASIDLASSASLGITCSWRLHAGQDCVISARFHGTKGGVAFRNVNGSFYDLIAERYEGTRCRTVAGPPDTWPGRAAVEWAKRLGNNNSFDTSNEELIRVAEVLDAIYAG